MINPKELLFSVDENNNPITPQPRKLSHETGIWHRACHIWIVNSKGQLLCQQRSLLKDSNPGKWEPFFGGHLGPKQTYVEAALHEIREELGLQLNETQLHFFEEHKYAAGTEFQGLFAMRWDGDIVSLTLEKEEVEQVAWRDVAEVEQLVVKEKHADWTIIGYEEALLRWLKAEFDSLR